MKISHRQGIISSQSNFLQIGAADTRFVDILVSPTPVIAAVASGNKDYLISESRTVTGAWGPFTGSQTQHLYWEINPANGSVSRSSTTLPPLSSPSAPLSPATGQMWWDTVANTYKVYNGGRWTAVLRVFAGTLASGGILIPMGLVSQVGLNGGADAGYILTDGHGSAFKDAHGNFLTSDTPLASSDTGSLVKIEGSQILVPANENIPKFSLVYLISGRAALASSAPPNNIIKSPIGMVCVNAYQNDIVSVVTSGKVVANDQWAWPTNTWGKPVYCDSQGAVTLTKPLAQKNVRVGTILTAQSMLLNLDWETEVSIATAGGSGVSGVSSVSASAPLDVTGSVDSPNITIPRATTSQDGFLNASDFARIPALESVVSTKSTIGHVHTISEVTGLQPAIDDKSDVNHTHLLSSLPDVSIDSPQLNQALVWNGTSWANSTVSGGGGSTQLQDLSDVQLNGLDSGDVLTWDGTAWLNLPSQPSSGSDTRITDFIRSTNYSEAYGDTSFVTYTSNHYTTDDNYNYLVVYDAYSFLYEVADRGPGRVFKITISASAEAVNPNLPGVRQDWPEGEVVVGTQFQIAESNQLMDFNKSHHSKFITANNIPSRQMPITWTDTYYFKTNGTTNFTLAFHSGPQYISSLRVVTNFTMEVSEMPRVFSLFENV